MIYWKERTKKLQKGRGKYCSEIFTLDTETTSLYIHKTTGKVITFNPKKKAEYYNDFNKVGFVYIWMLGINDVIYYGREMKELQEFMFELNAEAKEKRLVFYVHNLSYEFQFLRDLFNFEVFAREERKVMKATIIGTNIELRCSLVLTNMKLGDVARQNNLPVQKLEGELDYNIVRNTKTTLTEQELAYCENDCLVIYHFIKKMLERYGHFKDIPLTSTGRVRKEMKRYIAEHNGKTEGPYNLKNWKRQISSLTEDVYLFQLLVKCFAGGYTHANAYFTGLEIANVFSVDFTSSYPAVMLTEKFPCSRFYREAPAELFMDTENYCYLMIVQFKNIKSKGFNNYISYDRTRKSLKNFTADNGRIASADFLEITCTDIDYNIIKENYTFDDFEIVELWKAKKDYLPRVFVEFIVCTYERKYILKEKLKEVKRNGASEEEINDIEVALLEAKQLLNALYGMTATNLINDEILYTEGEWKRDELDDLKVQEMLIKQRREQTMFLPYSWAPFITAYSRQNLWWLINKIDSDVVYCDTDSCKYINNHDKEINEYNKIVGDKLRKMMKHYHIESKYLAGIGEFDKENDGRPCQNFKTLGAKKYLYKIDDTLHLTLAGVNKKEGIKGLTEKPQWNPFKKFKDGFVFKCDYSGKLTHTYNDNQQEFDCVDFQGNTDHISQVHGIHLQKTTYEISSTGEYITFQNQIRRSDYLENLIG